MTFLCTPTDPLPSLYTYTERLEEEDNLNKKTVAIDKNKSPIKIKRKGLSKIELMKNSFKKLENERKIKNKPTAIKKIKEESKSK